MSLRKVSDLPDIKNMQDFSQSKFMGSLVEVSYSVNNPGDSPIVFSSRRMSVMDMIQEMSAILSGSFTPSNVTEEMYSKLSELSVHVYSETDISVAVLSTTVSNFSEKIDYLTSRFNELSNDYYNTKSFIITEK